MKKHDILFQAQEEAFIQALEEEMARETPDPNAIRAILDQLDRQTGGAAFDPDAGWRELQTRRPAKRRRLGRYPVVLAAVLVCLAVAGTALAVNLGEMGIVLAVSRGRYRPKRQERRFGLPDQQEESV